MDRTVLNKKKDVFIYSSHSGLNEKKQGLDQINISVSSTPTYMLCHHDHDMLQMPGGVIMDF